jgi:hypothetical protein
MSAEVRARNDRTADLASQFRERLLSATMEKVQAGENPLDLMTADLLRVLRDSEDRAYGTPKQPVEHAGEGGGPIKHQVSSDDAFAAFVAALGGHAAAPASSGAGAGEVEGGGAT